MPSLSPELKSVRENSHVRSSGVYLDTIIDDNAITFYGTDNGIVSMTNFVGFILDRFIFHSELFNR
ncbi:hypothetical protein INT48_005627 [Thamnidium elegans]|uniref:Uncharacterized protein n=1 Tax=Thamnidium elegans TaxID=101142 RepID=A0A8H7SLT4_9FUNG|nr:hypothetical protein INT48_005627 [Thamnidium elegans]